MALYRVKQFMWSIGSYFKDVDKNYVNKYLNEEEKVLFNKLKHNDKIHSIRVCKDAIELTKNKNIDIDVNKVAKAALLHDVGKGEYGLNVIEKSALVMLNKVTRGNLKRYDSIKHIDIYYNHGKKGADILKKFNTYDKQFLDCIRYHHSNKNWNKNELLDIIKESDDKN